MPKTFVIGDIHGAYRALMQCLEKSSFDYENDRLISLGDVCDGWPETKQCVDELLKVKNLTYILGNHDHWALEWMRYGIVERIWYIQGGEATINSYNKQADPIHRDFFERALPYYVHENKLFVHAGFDPQTPIEVQTLETFLWDRDLARIAIDFYQKKLPGKLTPYDDVYIGHTPVALPQPVYAGGVWLMDTGAGWLGVLSMMNVETKEVFTSDPVPELYPGVKGRTKT